MKSMAKSVGIAMMATAALSCSNDGSSAGSQPGAGTPDPTNGAVRMQLTTDPGVVFDAIDYTVAGPNNFTRSRALDVSHATAILFTEGVLPAGGPFTITLGATSVDGTVTCAGMAGFTVVAGTTVGVSMPLQCHKMKTKGSVAVDASFDICPNIDGIETNPQETTLGHSILLTGYASDADPAATITYAWTATSGTVSSPATAQTRFTCTAAGTALLTLDITDGDCGDEVTLPVICDYPLDSGGVDVDASVRPGVCPSIDGIDASPQATTVGNAVTLTAAASSIDPNATITYAWSAPTGTFDAPTGVITQFTCTTKGAVTVTLTIADGSGCGDTLPIDVICE